MESLHNKIMNIPVRKAMSEIGLKDNMISYKEGHRDARHEAAEMAFEYESLIEELVEALEWYVKEDDTYEGGSWEEENKYWLDGKRKAEALINKVKHD